MKKRKAIAIIGEGITEKFYIESLKGISPFTVKPRALKQKASSLAKLNDFIQDAIDEGFDEVYCLIDMDSKKSGSEKTKYLSLKTKFHNKIIVKKNKGIECSIKFIETDRCFELWFIYHFLDSPITREFTSYPELEKELKKFRPNYEKTEKYFKSIISLHNNLTLKENPKGSIEKAVINSIKSIKSKVNNNRDYTYSEMHFLIQALNIIDWKIIENYFNKNNKD